MPDGVVSSNNNTCGVCQGKVRDTYDVGDKLVIVTTDRQSAFDRLLASVPFKACA
jgi:phosphoribosylaminoimidazole-succinocarboxamide synthase